MNKDELFNNLNKILPVSKEKLSLLETLTDLTIETNKSFNLTAIKEPDNFREKMIFDSALPLSKISLKDKKAIDIGTGAGFPGLVLSLLGESHLDLLDSTAKKINYINALAKEHNIDVTGIVGRSEEFAKKHREEYDFAFARAVSDLYILIEIIVPMLKVGGVFVAYKGPKYQEELLKAKSIMDKLGVTLVETQKEVLPFSLEERDILYLKKTKVTPIKYPRLYQDIIK